MKTLGPEKLRTGRSHSVIPGASKAPGGYRANCLPGLLLSVWKRSPTPTRHQSTLQEWSSVGAIKLQTPFWSCLVMLNTACCVSPLPDGGTCLVLQLGETMRDRENGAGIYSLDSLASSGRVMSAQNFCSPIAVSNIQLPLFSVSASPQPPKMSQLPAAGSRRLLLAL